MSMIMILEAISEEATVEQADRATVPFSSSPVAGWLSGMAFTAEDVSDEFSENSVSLEKAWHGLHFLLTGDPWGGSGPRAFLLCGGTEQGEDMGYGPARLFEPEEISQIAETLSGITNDELWSRFAPEQMADADLYGAAWDDEPEEDLREEFTEYFQLLKEFMANTAAEGCSLRITMT